MYHSSGPAVLNFAGGQVWYRPPPPFFFGILGDPAAARYTPIRLGGPAPRRDVQVTCRRDELKCSIAQLLRGSRNKNNFHRCAARRMYFKTAPPCRPGAAKAKNLLLPRTYKCNAAAAQAWPPRRFLYGSMFVLLSPYHNICTKMHIDSTFVRA